MMICRQACPFNTLEGCKVEEYNAICHMSNSVTPITEYRMTNADLIRDMTDEELAEWALHEAPNIGREYSHSLLGLIQWLKQPAEETK